MTNALSTLVGPIIRNGSSWNLCVVGADDCVYGIPYYDAGHNAGQVIRFNPLDNSLTEIGPILDNGVPRIESGWSCGVLAGNDCIYCIPFASNSRGVLKIDTINGTVTLLDVELLRAGRWFCCSWDSGALAIDGCIYFMPGNNALRILKLNPENDTVSSVGQCVRTAGEEGVKYGWTVVGDCLYGIPNRTKRILRFDPVNQTVTSVWPKGELHVVECVFRGCGVLGRDGHIYALDKGNMNWKMVGGILSIRVLKIDISNNDWSIVGNMPIYSDHDHVYSNCILGSDGCIYWPPGRGTHFLKFDPKTKHVSFVGGDIGHATTSASNAPEWTSGALAPDGAIYCMPDSASQVLCIDPFKEFTTNLNDNMEQHPEELGFLFRKNSTIVGETMYESSIRKFGEKASNAIEKALEDCIQDNELFEKMNFHPFMIAASLENSELSVVYYLLRGDPSMFNVYVV